MGSDAKKGQTYWNLAADPAMGGIQGYQAGSTFKVFTLAAALEKGIPISKKFHAKSPFNFTGRRYQSCHGRERIWDHWVVKNSVGHSKTIGMMEAAQWSVNTYFIQLELATGMCRSPRWPTGPVSRWGSHRPAATGHRQVVSEQAVVHSRHRRGQPAVDGRGVRDLRGPRHPLRSDHRFQDHNTGWQEPWRTGCQLPAGGRQGRR
jgi:hypothetical protein